MSLGDKIRSGTKWLMAGNVGRQVLQFLFGVALARLLLPADFGMIVTVQVFTGVVGFFAGGGMGQAIIQAKEVKDRDYHIVFTLQLCIGLLIFGGFYLLAPYFAEWFNDPLYRDLMIVSAINFLMRPFISVHNAYLNREMQFKKRTIVSVISGIFTGVVSVIMALTGFGVWSLVLSGLAGALLSIILLNRISPVKYRFGFEMDTAKRLGSYGFKISVNDAISYVRLQIGNLIVSRMAGSTAVGLFNKAESLSMMPVQIISNSAYQTVFRALSSVQDNKDKSTYIYIKTATLLTVYMMPIYVGLWWLAEPFIVFLFGMNWIDAAAPLAILTLAGLLHGLGHPAGAVLAARNQLGREITVHSISLVLVVVGTFIGLNWGIVGVAWAVVISKSYGSLHIIWFAARSLDVSLKKVFSAMIPALKLNVILFFTLFATHNLLPENFATDSRFLYLVSMSLVGGATYILCFLYLPIEELRTEGDRVKNMIREKFNARFRSAGS